MSVGGVIVKVFWQEWMEWMDQANCTPKPGAPEWACIEIDKYREKRLRYKSSGQVSETVSRQEKTQEDNPEEDGSSSC